MTNMQKYHTFIQSIDTSVANANVFGDLAVHINRSATNNAYDTMQELETNQDSETYWEMCLSNAQMILDDWKSFYPELVKLEVPEINMETVNFIIQEAKINCGEDELKDLFIHLFATSEESVNEWVETMKETYATMDINVTDKELRLVMSHFNILYS